MALQVGIQLYSVRQHMEKDPMGTIEQVAGIGYKYLQMTNRSLQEGGNDLATGFGVSADKFREKAEQLGIKLLATHFSALTPENASEVAKVQKYLGADGLIRPIDFFLSKQEVLEKCAQYNKVGEACAKEGMKFYYHNHSHEFQPFEGESALDLIVKNTDPALVDIELDTYWAMRGGVDPVAYLRKLGKRNTLLHQKDYTKGLEDKIIQHDLLEEGKPVTRETFLNSFTPEYFTEIGCGIMDIQKIIDTVEEIGASKYIILEQDYTALDEIESIKLSMESFKKFKNIVF